ncbi:MAG: hypothetical protein C0498_01260 [Anaerolinea sp.]|nr:hypothetical protein [Anaerolinea sp.]
MVRERVIVPWSDDERAAARSLGWAEFHAIYPERSYDGWRIKRQLRNRVVPAGKGSGVGLIDELRADQDPRAQCKFCAWLAGRPNGERAEWADAVGDRSFTHMSLVRAARKRGYAGGPGSVESHRKNSHAT